MANEDNNQIKGNPPIAFSQSQMIQSHFNAIDDVTIILDFVHCGQTSIELKLYQKIAVLIRLGCVPNIDVCWLTNFFFWTSTDHRKQKRTSTN